MGNCPGGCKESDLTERLNTYLIYNVVLASALQQSDSVIYYIYIYLFFSKFFSHLGCYRILNRVPCAIQSVLVGYLNKTVFAYQSQSLTLFTSISNPDAFFELLNIPPTLVSGSSLGH